MFWFRWDAKEWGIWRDTYLQPPALFHRLVIRGKSYDDLLSPSREQSPNLSGRLLRKLWFWPRIEEAAAWAQAAETGYRSPHNYLRTEPTRPAQWLIDNYARDLSVLELACNSGSDLDFVRRAGFHDLRGVDASASALNLFRETFPETWSHSQVSHDLFQRFLTEQRSNSVDVLFSNGAAIELVHPSFPIAREMCRVTRRAILLELNPRNTGYPRKYIRQFTKGGFRVSYSTADSDPVTGSHLYELKSIT